ncbi:hypothetical protein [Streptomyces hydrogenans]|uniref:hypothetical protein n=1 Tax=Streptomyces hydrogenans TaxID=1873719 RepID=UPI003811367E
MLAEIGDDRSRFTDAKGLKAFTGAASATRACGRRLSAVARQVRTRGSPRPATCGRSPPPPHPMREPTTTADAKLENDTPPPTATFSTAYSAASPTASPTTPPTPRTPPSHPRRMAPWSLLFDSPFHRTGTDEPDGDHCGKGLNRPLIRGSSTSPGCVSRIPKAFSTSDRTP